ncbi:MAG: response regulator, partial [Bacteroidales bacterium]|nr:response regulator [Bacteroidales bacterium]
IVFGYHYLKKTKEIFFYVQDTGIGIAKAKLPVILERFRQEDDSHTRKFEGTGLGLAITKEIVALLGGELKVESQKNRGSIFCFTLPFVPYKEEKISQGEISIENLNWKDKCILIVEDEEVNFVLLKAMLDPTKAVIFYAKNGRRALEMIKDNKLIDLVLLDIKLPEINGYEIAKRIRKLNKNIRIIAQTAYYGPEERKKAIEAGCHDFIPKPIVKTKLLKMIHDQFQK